MAIRIRNDLVRLRSEQRGALVGPDVRQVRPQPNEEEVRQVRVSHVVVVRRIGRDRRPANPRMRLPVAMPARRRGTFRALPYPGPGVSLHGLARNRRRQMLQRLANPSDHRHPVGGRGRERIALSEIPRHRDRLTPERASDESPSGPRAERRPVVGALVDGECQIGHDRVGIRRRARPTLAQPPSGTVQRPADQHEIGLRGRRTRGAGRRSDFARRSRRRPPVAPDRTNHRPAAGNRPIGESAGLRISQNPLPNLPQQSREGRQSHQLPRREQLPPLVEAVGLDTETEPLDWKQRVRPPAWPLVGRLRFSTRCCRAVRSAREPFGHDRKQFLAHPACTAFGLDV